MSVLQWSGDEALEALGDPGVDELLAGAAALVLDLAGTREDVDAAAALARARCPVVVLGTRPGSVLARAGDVVLSEDAGAPGAVPWDGGRTLDRLLEAVTAHPTPARVLVDVLRAGERLPATGALAVESLAYSTLLAGGDFRAWLAEARPAPGTPDRRPPVRAVRTGDVLEIVLDRPHVRNAYDASMRDALVECLDVAAADASIRQIVLRGAGCSFSSGGDLREFGTSTDVAAAHALRMRRSVAARMARVALRVTAFVHGPLFGAGVELPAFAGRVVADPATTFCLPELRMGLIPGAGGTVSIARRVGRQRAGYLALSGRAIDAATARSWGLVDDVVAAGDWPFGDAGS